jgi:hypothetical protein
LHGAKLAGFAESKRENRRDARSESARQAPEQVDGGLFIRGVLLNIPQPGSGIDFCFHILYIMSGLDKVTLFGTFGKDPEGASQGGGAGTAADDRQP